MNQTEVGFRIKQCRKIKKLTQENLAELINVSPHYIYEIEKGMKTMSLPTLVDIASALELSTDYLLFGTQSASITMSEKKCSFDRLNQLLQNLSPQQRDNVADILEAVLPHLK